MMEEPEDVYFVQKAKEALADSDPFIAKGWLINARVLFPDNFDVQFESYLIEKFLKDTEEAAKCLSDVFNKFPDALLLWKEIHSITTALQSTSGNQEAEFLRDIFNHVSRDVQRRILLASAERSEDTMEHCRLTLLLLNRFPSCIGQHGLDLMDILMTAEKHKYYKNPVNCYRKLLVCDVAPLLGPCPKVSLPEQLKDPRRLMKILNKAIEFFLSYMMAPNKVIPELPESECRIEDPWKCLSTIFHIIGEKLDWKLSGIFIDTLSRDVWWETLVQRYNDSGKDEVMYCAALILLHTLHEYNHIVRGGAVQLALVECDVIEIDTELGDPKPKRQRMDQIPTPRVTLGKNDPMANTPTTGLVHNLLMAIRCWNLLFSSELLRKLFDGLCHNLKLESWYGNFAIDRSLYKGEYEDCVAHVMLQFQDSELQKHIRLANLRYYQGHYCTAAKSLFIVVSELSNLPNTVQTPTVSAMPHVLPPAAMLHTQMPQKRHLYFLQLAKMPVLKYCVDLLLSMLKTRSDSDLAIGHMFVLLQFDWPIEGDLAVELFQRIKNKGVFTYHLFQTYVVRIELLEKFMWLSTEQAGYVVLDLFVPIAQQVGQRRITTRGADKGSKEDFKLAMRKQVVRCDDPIDALIIKFITTEHDLIMQAIQGRPRESGTSSFRFVGDLV